MKVSSELKTSEGRMALLVIIGGFFLSRFGFSEECKDEVVTKLAPYISGGLASVGYAISRGIAKMKGG